MNRATRTTASIIGICGGLLGVAHGYFETLQGDILRSSISINAIGAPCQPGEVWHACFPAMSLAPNLLVGGILTMLLGIAVVTWSAGFLHRPQGGRVLLILGLLLLLTGGGFLPPFYSLLAAFVASRILQAEPGPTLPALAILWPWALALFALWTLGGWIPGIYFNENMVANSGLIFIGLDIALPLLTTFSALAKDRKQS